MRRIAALAAAIGLLAGVAGPGLVLAARSTPSFVGDFAVFWDTGGVSHPLGRLHAQLSVPDERQLVPGTYDLTRAGAETHAIFGDAAFWLDPDYKGGARVAFGEGVECHFWSFPGGAASECGVHAVMFIDVLDPSEPDEVAFSWYYDQNGWFFEWRRVGSGSFQMLGDFPTECPFYTCPL